MDTDHNYSRITVVHSVREWLHPTENWIYTQIKSLPECVENHVACEQTVRQNGFSISNLHSQKDSSPVNYILDKAMMKAGIRKNSGHLSSVLRKTKASVLHSHFGHYAWKHYGAAKSAGVKHVASFYGSDAGLLPRSDPRWNKRYPDLFTNAAAVLCEGPSMKSSVERLGCHPEKAIVHHLGVDLEQYPFCINEWNAGEPYRILMAATFREKKGLPYGIEALGKIKDKASIEIVIAGDSTGHPAVEKEKQNILNAIERNKLGPVARMAGFLTKEQLRVEARKSHVFLSPSVTASDGDMEGGAPVSIIEMCALGLPVVSSFHCDIPEVIIHEKTGLLSPERDSVSLADNILKLIHDPALRNSIALAARDRVETHFNAGKQGILLHEIYSNLL